MRIRIQNTAVDKSFSTPICCLRRLALNLVLESPEVPEVVVSLAHLGLTHRPFTHTDLAKKYLIQYGIADTEHALDPEHALDHDPSFHFDVDPDPDLNQGP